MSLMPSSIWAPKGETGDKGPPGDKGPTGDQGPEGPIGPPGIGVPQLISDLANDTDPSKGAGMVGFKGTTLYKALGSLELSVTINSLWPSQPGLAINQVIALCESLGGGTVITPAADVTLETGVVLTRRVKFRGSGRNTSIFRWNQTGPAFKFQPAAFLAGPHSVEDFTITNVTGSPIAGSCGIEVSDTFGFGIMRISITNLDTDIKLHNRNFWTEGTVIEDVSQFHCNNGLTFIRDPSPATATDSFAYTNIRNYSTEPNPGGFCLVLGDDAVSTRMIRIYNCILHVSAWHKAGAAAVKWGANTTVNQSAGSLRSEGFDGAANLQPGLNGATNGLRQFTGEWITNDGGRTEADQLGTKRMDFRAIKFRDLGQSGPGGFQSPPKWFKCVNLTQTKGNISGSLYVSAAYGGAGSYSGNADFFFGRGGALQRPAFSVTGDAFSGTGPGTPRLCWVKETASGDEALYFYRPAFTNVAAFTYAYDAYLNGLVGNASEGIGLQELWAESVSPIGLAGTTLLYDTQGSFLAQQMYVGDEMAFAGQRHMLTINGDGVTKIFTFTHSLGTDPEFYQAVAVSSAAIAATIISQDLLPAGGSSTVLQITTNTAPPVGVGNVVFAITIGRKRFRKTQKPPT